MRRSRALAVLVAVVLGMSLLPGPAEARRHPKPDANSPATPPPASTPGGSGVSTGGEPHDRDIFPASAPAARPGLGAQADATWRVDSTGDNVNGSCGPAPINGTCTLRAALFQANVSTGVQTIIVPVGTFGLTVGGADDTGVAGDLDIAASRTVVIKGQGPDNTIINANGIDRVFDVLPGATFTLTDAKITGGSVSGASGGGLRNRGVATLDNVQVVGNSARASGSSEGDGAGIVNQSGATLTVSNSLISGNTAIAVSGVGGFGGGLGNFTGSTASLLNTEVSGNTAGINGGGITQNQDGSIVSLTSSIVSGNTGVAGGGIASGGTGTTRVNLTSSSLVSNTATGGNGGGITMANQSGILTVINSTVSNNVSPTNNSGFSGGGIRIGGPGSSASITSSTIVNNTAFAGGGISSISVNGSAAFISIADSVLANNTGGNCSTTYSDNNNADSGSSCGFARSNSNTLLSTGGPATNEGFTPVFVPPAGSSLIDAAGAGPCFGQSVDQRGVARPQNGLCDIGSVEVQPTNNLDCGLPSRLKVITTRQSAGVLLVTITTNNASNQVEVNNRIKAISFGASPNTIVLPSRPVVGGTQVQFQLIRPLPLTAASASGAGTQPFVITDRCGNYNSFAGAGANSWQ